MLDIWLDSLVLKMKVVNQNVCTQALNAVNQNHRKQTLSNIFFTKSKFDRKSSPVIWDDSILLKRRIYILIYFKVFRYELFWSKMKGQTVCALSA